MVSPFSRYAEADWRILCCRRVQGAQTVLGALDQKLGVCVAAFVLCKEFFLGWKDVVLSGWLVANRYLYTSIDGALEASRAHRATQKSSSRPLPRLMCPW